MPKRVSAFVSVVSHRRKKKIDTARARILISTNKFTFAFTVFSLCFSFSAVFQDCIFYLKRKKHNPILAAMNSETNSDPLDVAVAVAQAMGQSNMDDSKPANDEMWQNFMNSSTAPSGFEGMMDQPLFPLDQTSSIDPLDPASCLSLLNNPAASTTSTSMAWPEIAAAEKQQQQQQWVHDMKAETVEVKLEPQQPTASWPGASSSMLLQQPARQTSMTFGGVPSSGMMLPPTPPVEQQPYGADEIPWLGMQMNTAAATAPGGGGSEPSPPASVETQPAVPMTLLSQQLPAGSIKTSTSSRARRRSSESSRPYRRRTSSHPSVASVVSLTAHEPVAHLINGIEHITFLYSHDRLVKEYTVRTDVENCSLDDIPMEFRVLNAVS